VQFYTLGIYEKAMPDALSLEDKLLAAKEHGFDFLELCIDQASSRQDRLNWSAKERADLGHFMARSAIPAATLSLSALRDFPLGSADPGRASHGIGMLRKSIDLASDLGCRIVLINAYDVFDEESSEGTGLRFLANLDRCTRYAAARGVMIGLENADREFGDTVRKTARLVRTIGSPFLKIYADIGNVANACPQYGEDPLSDLDSGLGMIAAVHLKDTLPGRYRFVRYGEGHVSFGSCISRLMQAGVGLYTAELFWTEGTDWAAEMRFVHGFLRDHFPAPASIGDQR
jgi:L-ribulose-5-phosphate 3-epimerase